MFWSSTHLLSCSSSRFLCCVYIPSRSPSPCSIFHLLFCLLFPKFRLRIAMVWNNSTTLSTYITSTTTSSIDFCVLVYVIGFLDPSTKHPNSYTNIFPSPNSNGCPYVDPSLITNTCNYGGLNILKGVCVSTLFVYNPVAYRIFCVYCCYCCCCCCKCWKCCELPMVSI